MSKPELFLAYPQLEKTIPFIPMGSYPTTVEKMTKLGEKLGYPSLWVKRDDLSSTKLGGNKVRIMEFLLAAMKASGKTVAISPGALGSNQILASGIYGHDLGFKIVGVFFKQCPTDYMCKHMMIDKTMGVEFNHVNSPYLVPFVILYQFLKNFDWGKMQFPFYIPTFGSSATCALGYFNAMFELKKQIAAGLLPEPDYIFVTAGTGGTMAGIQLGTKVLGMKTKTVGVRITDYVACNERIVASILNRAVKHLRKGGAALPELRFKKSDISMIHEFFGGEYAKITDEALAAKKLVSEIENLTLDTTYTAKTMAAMIKYLKDHDLKDKNILFWHTYNTKDLTRFLDKNLGGKDLPQPFQCYFK